MGYILRPAVLVIAASVASASLPAGEERAAAPREHDNPADVAALEGMSKARISIEKDADGNVRTVYLSVGSAPNEVTMRRLQGLRHIRALEVEVPDGAALAKLVRAWPTLQRVKLWLGSGADGALDAISGLPELRELDLSAALVGDEQLGHLTGPPSLAGLNLARTYITDAALAAVGRLKGLRSLDLSRDCVTDQGLPSLSGLKKLATLTLVQTDVQGSGLKALAGLPNLRELDLRGTGVTEEAVAPLRGIAGLHIRGVRTREQMLTADDPRCYAALRAARFRLDRDDAGNVVSLFAGPTPKPAEWIANLDGLHSLEALYLPLGVTDADMSHVGRVASLTALSLGRGWRVGVAPVGVTNAGVARVAPLEKLRRLQLRGCRYLNDDALAAVARFKGLEDLDLAGTSVTGPGLRYLAALKMLKRLDLSDTPITDAGLSNVAAITGLEVLAIGGTSVTRAAALQLRAIMKRLREVDR